MRTLVCFCVCAMCIHGPCARTQPLRAAAPPLGRHVPLNLACQIRSDQIASPCQCSRCRHSSGRRAGPHYTCWSGTSPAPGRMTKRRGIEMSNSGSACATRAERRPAGACQARRAAWHAARRPGGGAVPGGCWSVKLRSAAGSAWPKLTQRGGNRLLPAPIWAHARLAAAGSGASPPHAAAARARAARTSITGAEVKFSLAISSMPSLRFKILFRPLACVFAGTVARVGPCERRCHPSALDR